MDEDGLSSGCSVQCGLAHIKHENVYCYFSELYNGILDDVITQKASMGWHSASPARMVVSLLTTKQEVQNLATNIGVMWFVEENRILEIVCRDEIAVAITCQVAKEHETLKEGRATKRRRKDGSYDKTKAQA